MNQTISLQDAGYISVKEGAKSAKFTTDYVASLCRAGKVAAQKIGKNWYVDQESLLAFAKNEEEAREARRQELAKEYARSRNVGITRASAPAAPLFDLHGALRVTAERTSASKRKQDLPGPRVAPQVFGRLTAATLAICLIVITWNFCAPQTARTIVANVLQNSSRTSQNVLTNNPQAIAIALRSDLQNAASFTTKAALAIGDAELSGVAQVGNAFTGYDKSAPRSAEQPANSPQPLLTTASDTASSTAQAHIASTTDSMIATSPPPGNISGATATSSQQAP